MGKFKLVADFQPTGDQPEAIDKLVDGLDKGLRDQTLLGITGSGKTFTMANVIARAQRPTLIMSHNKTLAAQLYSEFRSFFPHNAVEYFVSYYDYYLPESYIPSTDTYIEKDTDINAELEKLRYAATGSLMTRNDVIIVSSVSCIYGLGMSLTDYRKMHLILHRGDRVERENVISRLVDMQYERNNSDPKRGAFRAFGDTLEVFPPGEEVVLRIEFDEDEVDHLSIIHPVTRSIIKTKDSVYIYPAKHFATPPDVMEDALRAIEEELEDRLVSLNEQGKSVEAYRLETRTRHDLEMLRETGFVKGIENYSRHFTKRRVGQPPYTLLDYFPKDFLLIVDESHQTLPQIRGMHNGDRSRKRSLVDFGFRLECAYDNRPLKFDEFDSRINQVIYTSATPAEFEVERSKQVVHQVVRPTGLLDPAVEIRPVKNQVDDLLEEIRQTVERGNRVLVTCLTKRMAEDLTEYLQEANVNARYLHSEVDTLDRVAILKDLRVGKFDVLVGINLLREGLDMPVVELVAILDADKEGFLRSETSLLQTIGRASRNAGGRVIMYADRNTDAMKRAIGTTMERRQRQEEYNQKHKITPKTIVKTGELDVLPTKVSLDTEKMSYTDARRVIRDLEREMKAAAGRLEFERAAKLRDEISAIRDWMRGDEEENELTDN